MKLSRFIPSVLIVLAVLAGACAAPVEVVEPPPEVVEFVGGEPAPPSVTEDFLRRTIATNVTTRLAVLFGDVLLGPLHRYDSRVLGVDSNKWTTDSILEVVYIANDAPGKQDHITFTIEFDEPGYAPGGSVHIRDCQTLEGSGTVASGEYRTVDNTLGTDVINEHYEDKVTLTHEHTTTLDENVTLSNKVTVGAEADFGAGKGSVSDELSTELAIDNSDTDDTSTSTEKTFGFDTTIPQGKKATTVVTENDADLRCKADIRGIADWGELVVTASPSSLMHGPFNHGQYDWGTVCTHTPENYRNWCSDIQPHPAAYDLVDGAVQFTFADGLDGALRFTQGTTTLLPPGTSFDLEHQALDATRWLEVQDNRFVVFHGTRNSQAQADVSYKLIDTTGVSSDCIDENFGTQGNDLRLDACE